MTVTQIEAEVDAYLNRAGVAAVDTRVSVWVQDELREWAENATWPPATAGRAGNPHNWTFLTLTYDVSTIADRAYYALAAATGFLRPIRLWLECVNGDRVTYLELEVLRQMYYGRNSSYPEHYGLEFNEDGITEPVLWVFPSPSQVWPAHLTYQKKAKGISGTQSNIFTIRWPDGLIAGATARGLRLLRGHEEAGSWVAEKGRQLAAAIAGDRKSESEEAMTLGISSVADGHPENPRPVLEDYPAGRKIDPASWD